MGRDKPSPKERGLNSRTAVDNRALGGVEQRVLFLARRVLNYAKLVFSLAQSFCFLWSVIRLFVNQSRLSRSVGTRKTSMIAHGARLEFCLKCLVTHMTLFVSYEAHPVSREMRLAFHKKCPLHSMCVWRFLASSVLFSCKAHVPYCARVFWITCFSRDAPCFSLVVHFILREVNLSQVVRLVSRKT